MKKRIMKKRKKRNFLVKVVVKVAVKVVLIRVWEEAPKVKVRTQREIPMKKVVVGAKVAYLNKIPHLKIL